MKYRTFIAVAASPELRAAARKAIEVLRPVAGDVKWIAPESMHWTLQFLGEVDDDDLVALYSGALAVVYPPFDEDFGYVTLEAFLSKKPVVTTADAGEPATFVLDGINGRVTEPSAFALADAITDLATHRARAAAYGATGYAWARLITWDHAIDRLVDGL